MRWLEKTVSLYFCPHCIRGVVLEELSSKFPELLPWAITCYGNTSHLLYGDSVIPSGTGLQQGDPLASLFYSLAQHPIALQVAQQVPDLPLHGWLLDDGSAVGDSHQLEQVVDIVAREGAARGLVLSTAATTAAGKDPKSTVWTPLYQDGQLDPLRRGVPRVQALGVTLLGSPIGCQEFVREALETKVAKVREIIELLPTIEDPHLEFVLLRACLSLPKISFFLRTVNTMPFPQLLLEFDLLQREALSRILGTGLSDLQWHQAQLPVSMGGLGLRGACHHASSSYASSVLSTCSQARALQGRQNDASPLSLPPDVLDDLSHHLGEQASVETVWGSSQKALSLKVDLQRQTLLQGQVEVLGNVREKARLASLGLHHAGAWLTVVPSRSLGLHLQPVQFVFAVKYRLGCQVYEEDGPCPACHQASDKYGDHALCCGFWGERITRHNQIRDHIFQMASSAVLNPVKEGRFLLPGNDRRPADVYLPNWSAGRDTALDITVVNPLQQATVGEAAVTPGHSLDFAFDRKMRGAADECERQGIAFLPLAFESLGGWHRAAVTEVKKIAQAMARQTGREESEVCSHAISRLSLLLMRGNSAILVNRIPSAPQGTIDGVYDE